MSANLGRAILEIGVDDSPLEAGLDKAESKAKAFVGTAREALKELKIDVNEGDTRAFKEVEKKAESLKEKLGGIGKAGIFGAGAVAGLGIGKGTELIGSFAGAVDEATSQTAKFQAKLGFTAEQAQMMGKLGKEVFADNWGESLSDVNGTLTAVQNSFGEMLDETGLKEVTTQALIMRDTFDFDVTESLKTASTMASNFGITGQDAMDLITKSAQFGADKSGDLLDTFNEYSVQFKSMGFDAKDFGNILVNGLSAGAFNADKVADAVKEFNIRIKDGSKTTSGALTGLGIDLNAFTAGLANGSITGEQAMELINEKLRNTKDTVMQNQLGVALYGTQWEDMGSKVILGLDQQTDAMATFHGSTLEAGNATSQTFGAQFEAAMRQAGLALQPLLMEAMDFARQAMPAIQAALPVVIQALKDGFTAVKPAIDAVFGWLKENAPKILDMLGGFMRDVIIPSFNKFVEVFQAHVLPALQELWKVIQEKVLPALMTAGKWFVENIFPVLGEFVGIIIGKVIPAIITIVSAIIEFLKPVFEWLGKFIGEVLVPVFQTIVRFFQKDLRPIIDEIANRFEHNLLPVLQRVGQFIGGVFTIAVGAIKLAFEALMWVIDHTVVPVFQFLWNLFANFLIPIFTTVAGVIGTVIGGAFGGLMWGIQNIIIPAFNLLVTGIGTVIDFVKNAVKTVANFFIDVINTPINLINGLIDMLANAPFIGDFFKGLGHIGTLGYLNFAAGTNDAPGGPSLFGEAGPELVKMFGRSFLATGPVFAPNLPKHTQIIPLSGGNAGKLGGVSNSKHVENHLHLTVKESQASNVIGNFGLINLLGAT
jgi:phage-related minor tail protein